MSDPTVAGILAEAKGGAEQRAAELIRAAWPEAARPEQAARQLVALSDSVTLGVLIGSLSPEQAQTTISEAMARLSSEREGIGAAGGRL